MNNTISRTFSISSFDLNPKGQARLTTMANLFQEMAYQHAGQLGFGYKDLKEKSFFWVLSRMRIRMERYPTWDDPVSVETWHRGMFKLFGLRDFRVTDTSGRQLGVATTAWLVLDSETRRPVRTLDDSFMHSKHHEQVLPDPLEKIVLPDALSISGEREVCHSDLDIVGHVNNVKYMEWCLDAAHLEVSAGSEIRTLEINFVHEALWKDRISLRWSGEPNRNLYYQAIRTSDEKEIFRARLEWE
jgi:acyl-ACP thioesterase